jgi:hypothetical protein
MCVWEVSGKEQLRQASSAIAVFRLDVGRHLSASGPR